MMLLLFFIFFAFWLLAPLYIIYKPPHTLIRYFQYRWPDVLWQVETPTKIVALTIDDAPSSHTAEIVEILKVNDAKATFFIIGSQAVGQEEMLADLVRGGHELGNHAMHDEPSKSLSNEELVKQIKTVQTLIADAYTTANVSQPEHRWFRPGSGFFSTKMRQTTAENGYQIALGSIYPHDPQIPYANVNARHILSMIRPGGIIICHDRRSWTAPMLRQVLPELKRKGYSVVGLTDLVRQAGG